MTRQTSIEAYRAIEESGLLSKRRWEVYRHVWHHGPLTQNEAARILTPGNVSGTISGRFSELKEMGLLIEVGKKNDPITGKSNYLWDATDRRVPIIKEKKTQEPTYKDIIESLCRLVEHAPKWVTHPAWVEKSQKVLKDASKYRKRTEAKT